MHAAGGFRAKIYISSQSVQFSLFFQGEQDGLNLRMKLFLTKACSTFAVWWCKTGQAFASRKLRWGGKPRGDVCVCSASAQQIQESLLVFMNHVL